MLRKNVKVELLRRLPLFSGCSKRELEQVATIADEIDFPAGRTLIAEGKRGLECFIVIDGEVEITRGGRRIPVRGGSELFGELALLTDQPRNATVTCVTAVHALVIAGHDFRALMKATPAIALKVLKSLAERVGSDAQPSR